MYRGLEIAKEIATFVTTESNDPIMLSVTEQKAADC
jgi:hypothetical protein